MMMLTITCHKCSIKYGVPDYWLTTRKEDGNTIWCPNGHTAAYGVEGEADRLRRERDKLKQDIAYWEDNSQRQRETIEAERRTASALRGQITKLKKRASAGVCPCCNRTFAQLRNHMRTQHPEYIVESNVVPLPVKEAS